MQIKIRRTLSGVFLCFLVCFLKEIEISPFVEALYQCYDNWGNDAHYTEEFETDVKRNKGYERMKTDLLADDFRFDEVSNNRNDNVNYYKTDSKNVISRNQGNYCPWHKHPSCAEYRECVYYCDNSGNEDCAVNSQYGKSDRNFHKGNADENKHRAKICKNRCRELVAHTADLKSS